MSRLQHSFLARVVATTAAIAALAWIALLGARRASAACQPGVVADFPTIVGKVVALEGDLMAIGFEFIGGQGFVTVLHRSADGAWQAEAVLGADDTGISDGFGCSLDLDGPRLIVGANRAPSNNGPGAAYVYRRVAPAIWIQEAKLTAADGAPNDRFGMSVAIQDLVAVVGANWDDDGFTTSGSAYVFSGSNGSWSQTAKLHASDPSPGEAFGATVAIDDDSILVGAPFDKGGTTTSGAVHVFSLSGGDQPIQKLTPPAAATGMMFGASIAARGGVLVASAPSGNKVFVYGNSGAGYALEGQLDPPGAEANAGATVDVAGLTVALTAEPVGQPGVVATFHKTVGGWTYGSSVVAATAPFDIGGLSYNRTMAIGGGQIVAVSGVAKLHDLCAVLTVVDPNFTNSPMVVDGVLVGDAETLLGPAPACSGITADGVSRVVLRRFAPEPGTVTFSVADIAGAPVGVGALSSVGGAEAATTLTVPTMPIDDGHVAIAVLQAPSDFVRTAADEGAVDRSCVITTTFTPQGGGDASSSVRNLRIHRPPVVLLHGIWDSPWIFKWAIKQDPRWSVLGWSYVGTNAASFTTNIVVPRQAVQSAVRSRRAQGIATTQADFVGMSMGGVLGRLYAGSALGSIYVRPENYNAGDIHKLITVDSPHFGSPLAKWVVDTTGAATWFGTLGQRLGAIGNPAGGGASDLRSDNPLYAALPAAPPPAHAIFGHGGSATIQAAYFQLPYPPSPMLSFMATLSWLGILPDLFPAALQHDFVVGRNSQIGLLPASATTGFGLSPVLPPVGAGWHWTIPKEQRVSDRLVELLNTPVTNPVVFSATGFPASAGGGLAGSEDPELPFVEQVDGITLTTNVSGAPQGGGVPLSISTKNGFVPIQVAFLSGAAFELVDEAPFSASLAVPADAFLTTRFVAMAIDADGRIAISDPAVVTVQSSAVLGAIWTEPESLLLFDGAPAAQALVLGAFSDGQVHDVTSPAAGTTYASLDRSIATVDEQGVVSAVAVGETAVVVSNAGSTTYVAVIVESVGAPFAAADLNRDGIVDGGDLGILLSNWGGAGVGDIDEDGDVDGADLGSLLAAWR